jgi:hypothetical protein
MYVSTVKNDDHDSLLDCEITTPPEALEALEEPQEPPYSFYVR